jgi:hypothetical protein
MPKEAAITSYELTKRSTSQQFPFMTDRLSMTYENGERSGPIDPLFAPEGASYRLSNARMRYDQQAQGAMET